MGRLAAIALASCAGCAQIFGIDNTTGGAAPADAPPAEVSLSFQRASIGSTIVMAPQDLSTSMASYLVSDGENGLDLVPAALTPPNTWTAPIATGTPPVEFTLPDYPTPITRVWAVPARTLTGVFGQLEHPNPTPMDPSSTLTFQVGLPSPYAGESLQEYSVGAWTQHTFSGAELPATNGTAIATTISASTINSLTGRPLDKITSQDSVLVVRYSGNTLTGALIAPPFDQTGADTISGTMLAVAQDQTLTATIQPAAVGPRYAATRPAVANLGMAWYVIATPGSSLANASGPQLAALGVAATDSGAIDATYGNPFGSLGWRAVFEWSTNEYRSYTPPGQPPVTAYAGMYEVDDPTPGLTASLPAALPLTISIDQTALTSDGMTVTIDPTKPVDVSFVAEHAGATLCQLQLFALVPNAGATALVYQQVFGLSGVMPEFTVPAALFQPGKLYVLRAVDIQDSYPGIASGDLATRSLPLEVAYLDSGVFTVVNP